MILPIFWTRLVESAIAPPEDDRCPRVNLS
jgi:hypothetical protein